jgi:RES domain-containing protein
MLEGKALAAALEEIGPSAFHGIIFRCVSLSSLLGLKNEAGHLVITRPNPDFLYAGGPVRDGGRFTPKGGAESLYTRETEHTARLEKRQAAGFHAVSRKSRGIEVAYSLNATLSRVLDLTDSPVVQKLDTSRSELVEPWRYRPDGKTPPTHTSGPRWLRVSDSARSAIQVQLIREDVVLLSSADASEVAKQSRW